MYSDFFPPPPRDRSKPPARKPESKKDKKGKKSKSSVRFSETDDVADMEEEAPEAGPSSSRDTMSRVRNDLFGEDDEAEEQAASANLSSHEKRMLALKEQIAALEQENIGPKDWTLLGEATSKARPENSLLEENLDFEHTGKVVPLVTEEKVLGLEEMIKKRILDVSTSGLLRWLVLTILLQENFDDVQRRREIDDKAFLPSRYFELQDAQSTRSLAQIYEDEYQAAASGSKTADPRDAKLTKDHEEIDKLWNDICYKLDALSNLHFTPKAVSTPDSLRESRFSQIAFCSQNPPSPHYQMLLLPRWRTHCQPRSLLQQCLHQKKCLHPLLQPNWWPDQNSIPNRSVMHDRRRAKPVQHSARLWTLRSTSLQARVELVVVDVREVVSRAKRIVHYRSWSRLARV